MAPALSGRTRPTKVKKQTRGLKRKRNEVDLETLQKAVEELDPKAPVTTFNDLPLSKETQDGLSATHFTTLTDIQKRAIPAALKGNDILS
jgi:ATP-dependent RNA helicase DDX10/DBP4